MRMRKKNFKDAPTDTMTPERERKRRTAMFLACAFLFALFIYHSERTWRRETTDQLVFCARTIENSVWDMDEETPFNYLNLLVQQNHYQTIGVSYQSGMPFLNVIGTLTSPWDRLLLKMKLIRPRAFETGIAYGLEQIGKISAIRYNTNIYRYLYALLVLTLVYFLASYFQQLVVARNSLHALNQQLDQKVRERTADLTALAEKYRQEIVERRQAEVALRDSEMRLRTLIRTIPDLVWLKDSKGTYLFCNSRFERFFGAREKEIIGRTDYDFFDRETADAFREHDRAAIAAGGPRRNEEEVTYADDGHHEILETIKTPIYDSEGQLVGVLGIGRDITERKQAEDALRYQEMLLEEMGRIAKIGGWEFDPTTGNGTWTAEVARIHGLDPAETTSVEMGLGFYRGDDRSRIEKGIAEAIEQGKPYDLEVTLTSAQGTSKWVHTRGRPVMSDGRVVKVFGSFQDITERKQAELQARESDERLRLALQAAQMGSWEWDVQKNRVVWSPETLDVFRTTADEFGGTYEAYLSFIAPSMRAVVDQNVKTFLDSPREYAVIQYEHETVRGDGQKGWVEVRGTLFLDPDGQPGRMTGICHDISERKRIELELEGFRNQLEDLVHQRTAQLEAANKELESFSYSVSHDLRAPLRALDGYSRILIEDYGPVLDAEGQRVCGIISDSARDMGKLIDDLLSFSRIGRSAIKPSTVDMATLARSIFFELTTEAERQRIDFRVDPLPPAMVDPALVRHVWTNLISNAVKFSANRPQAEIRVSAAPHADGVAYAVRDNGAGFDMQYANKLFGVFQRLHSAREFEGTGVGLAIVQRIVSRHGGRIWAQSTVDNGAEFHFTLPAAAGSSVNDADQERRDG